MVHAPAVMKVSAPLLLMVHTSIVAEVKVTSNPALLVALSVGVVPKVCEPGLVNVIVCPPEGVTAVVAVEEADVPALLVAMTVNV